MSPVVMTENQPPSIWEEYAKCYDSLRHLTPYMDMLRTVAGHVTPGSQERLLDASCGTGNFEQVLLEHPINHTMSIVGVDSSKEMLARAHKKCRESACVSFFEADLNSTLIFDDESFSHVTSINTLYAVANPEYTLSEFHRVLERGGRLLLVTPLASYENGLIMKEHCMSNLPDDFWMDAHSSPEREELLIRKAINNEEVIKDMLTVARHNRSIAKNNNFHFFTKERLLTLLNHLAFSVTHTSRTYANQAVFIVATKL